MPKVSAAPPAPSARTSLSAGEIPEEFSAGVVEALEAKEKGAALEDANGNPLAPLDGTGCDVIEFDVGLGDAGEGITSFGYVSSGGHGCLLIVSSTTNISLVALLQMTELPVRNLSMVAVLSNGSEMCNIGVLVTTISER